MPFMSPLRKLYNLCIRVRAILPAMHHATPSVTGTDELSTLVNRAYELLVDKLGSPSDSGVPMYASYGALTICIRSRRGRYYIIVTEDPGWSIPVRVAHEVYHRITFNTIGTRDEVWVDEMMAMRASDGFLRCQKLQYEAAFIRRLPFAIRSRSDSGRTVPKFSVSLVTYTLQWKRMKHLQPPTPRQSH
jgi:hypothetical protein